MRLNQVTIPAKNISDSIQFYTRMGFTQIVDAPHYARFIDSTGESTFSIHLQDEPINGAVIYFEVELLDAKVKELKSKGFEFTQDPVDQTWLWREAYLKDPSGNVICLYWAGKNRLYPPWRINP